MKQFIVIAFALCCSTAIAHAEREIGGNETDSSHDCTNDGDVQILAKGGHITITGKCHLVQVSGDHNHVTIESSGEVKVMGRDGDIQIEAADRISTWGEGNVVTYKRAVTAKKKTRVSNPGKRNKIRRVKA